MALEALLSKPALALAKQLLAEGLGIYVYYYPAPPVRVRDVDTLLAGLDFRQRLFALMAACEPEQAIRRWTSTFVRILQLGLLPGTLASLHTGVCCQPQNACIDGGFVDMDSLLPFAALADDAAVQAALQFSTESLLDSVGTLLVGGADSTRDTLAGRGDRNALEDYVLTLIEDGLMLEARSGLSLDPRARAYFARRPSFEALVARLAARRAPAAPSQAAATRAFGELGLELLRTARSSYAVGSSGASGSNP